MLSIIKRKYKNAVMPNASMTAEKYMSLVENDVVKHWEDKELMEMLGLKKLFTEKSNISSKMTYDEICECIERCAKMVNEAFYVIHIVCARANAISEKNINNDELDYDVKRALLIDHDEFYSVENIIKLFVEAKDCVKEAPVEKPENIDAARSKLHSSLNLLPNIKSMVFTNIHMSAILENL